MKDIDILLNEIHDLLEERNEIEKKKMAYECGFIGLNDVANFLGIDKKKLDAERYGI